MSNRNPGRAGLRQIFWVGLGTLIAAAQFTVVASGGVVWWLSGEQAGGTNPYQIAFAIVLCAMALVVGATAWLRLLRPPIEHGEADIAELIQRLERASRGLREAVFVTLAVTAVTLFLVLLPDDAAGLMPERALLAVLPGLLFVLYRQQEDASLLGQLCHAALSRDRVLPPGYRAMRSGGELV